jgi:uncharacterized protein YcaQ
MSDRTRIDHYRGRKDSALALHYLWRVGEAMVSRRDRFERVYALTEAVAPASALRDVDEAEADDVLARKAVAASGLARMAGINTAYVNRLKAGGPRELDDWRLRGLADGSLIDVRVEGWRTPQLALGEDAGVIAELEAGRVPAAWTPIGATTTDEATFLSPLDPVSARGRAKPLFGFDYVWEVYKPVEKRSFGYYTMPILWGDRLVGRFDPKLDRSSRTLMILGLWLEDPASAQDTAFADALAAGMRRFMTLLGVGRIDVAGVSRSALRRSLAGLGRRRRASGSPDDSPGAIRAAASAGGQAATASGIASGRRATTARTTPQANTSAAAPSIAAPRPAPTDTKPMTGG